MKVRKNIGILKVTALLMVLFILQGKEAWSQQDPVYTQYMNNIMSVNPAYTAVRGVGSFSGVFRNQWVNLDGAPKSASLTCSMPIDSLHMGLGIDFLHDYTVPLTTTALFLNYSYRIKVASNSTLSFGLKAGVNYLDARLTNLYRYHLDDEYILGNGDFKKPFFNAGVGLFWFNDNFYAGFSIPRLLENNYTKGETTVENTSHESRHYFLQGAYMVNLSPEISFKPGIMTIMTAGAPVTADFDFSFLFHQQICFGMMYRISDALGGYMQFQYKNMKLGFSYDYSHTRIHEFQSGTFEVMLRYDFKTKGRQVFPLPMF
ncbi:MAG TPA: type IX secretion system membrane protein PorP/SprF [Prolixibacteraceae bacterium]|nr:type IX secretion system membrane protein PorP/SprF [Prolixibacteraceae bacterium]